MARSARMPLQTGASAVGKPLVFIVIYTVVCSAGIEVLFGDVHFGAFILLFMGALAGMFLLPYSLQWRASDVVLDEEGLVVRGGPRNGTRLAWTNVDPDRCSFDRDVMPAIKSNVGNVYAYRMIVGTRDGRSLELAQCINEVEKASMWSVFDSIRALSTTRATEPEGHPAPAASEVLHCDACGAPVAPADVDAVSCPFCGAKVTVPAELRARVSSASTLSAERASARKLAIAVLRQPDAPAINARLALLTATLVAAALAGSVGGMQMRRGDVALGALAIVIGAFAAVRTTIADRVALRDLSSYGAAAPARPGAPHTCRCCRAPLPNATDDVAVVRCVYCNAENVLGVDLRTELTSARTSELELSGALDARIRTRRARNVALAVAAALLAAGLAVHFG